MGTSDRASGAVASAVLREVVAAPFKASMAAVAQPAARASAAARAWEVPAAVVRLEAAAEPPEAVAVVVQEVVGVVEAVDAPVSRFQIPVLLSSKAPAYEPVNKGWRLP